MIKSILASILAVLLLSACASLAQFQQFMDHYIGQPIASVQDAFGYNFTERTLDDGRKAYTWQWSRQGLHRVIVCRLLCIPHAGTGTTDIMWASCLACTTRRPTTKNTANSPSLPMHKGGSVPGVPRVTAVPAIDPKLLRSAP
ncbi:MAG: hypothetical protein R3F53_04285 [Gammaproteobacteria bacterium]